MSERASAGEERTSVTEEFDDDTAGLDFSPAVSATGAEPLPAHDRIEPLRPAQSRRWRRRVAGGVVLLAALVSMGGAYALFANTSGAADSTSAQGDLTLGRSIYETTCITCHGANLQGVTGRGVSLIGAGSAATYFQLSTGRMPASAQGADIRRKPPKYNEAQIAALAAYVQSVGGGPTVPEGDLRKLGDYTLADGGELFRLNCASCHGSTGGGAPLSAGKIAPGLHEATDKQIYTAMLSGPENMPVFSDNQLTPDQKHAIIDYIQTLNTSKNPGGNGLARIGPVSEGLVVWVVGIGAVIVAILWIGAKS
jgi:ubiquinol-cytochrome c reductase cytochrome c subunit